jgi:hypothetical protein
MAVHDQASNDTDRRPREPDFNGNAVHPTQHRHYDQNAQAWQNRMRYPPARSTTNSEMCNQRDVQREETDQGPEIHD